MNNKFCLSFLVLFFLSVFSFAQPSVTLEEVVQMAIQKNYDIRLQQNTAASAFTDNRYAYGAFLPQFNLSGSASKSKNFTRTLAFYNPATPTATLETIGDGADVTTLNGSALMSWTIFDGTKMFVTRKRISALASLGELNVKNQMMNTVALAMTNFYGIVRQKQQLKAIGEIMLVNEERVKLAERKLEVGTGAKPELLQAKVDLNAQRTAYLQQEIVIRQLKDQLNGQLGLGLPEVYDVQDTIPILTGLSLDEIARNIENTNTTLIAAKKNIEIASYSLKENKRGRSPIISLVGGVNYNRVENAFKATPFTTELQRLLGFSYGVNISVPIINFLNVDRQIQQAAINLDRQNLVYEQQKTLALIGVKVAFINYETAEKILEIQEENIRLAKENVSIALQGFRRGIITYIELRTANQSLSDAYNQLIAARFSTKASEIELMRLSGALIK